MRILMTGLLVLTVSACGQKPAAGKTRPPPLVVTEQVAVIDVPVLARAPVDVRPIAQADVGSKTVGYLDAVLVDRGDLVKKGQLLALVRPAELSDQLSAAKSAVAQAQASAALAKANLERAQTLAPKGLVSQQELQNATSAAAASDAQLASAQAQLGVYATRLGETRLEAPFEGVVVSRRLDPGALVGASSGVVLTVARLDVVRVFVSVNERQAPELKLGQAARVRFDAFPGRDFEGKVERLAPAFDPLTRTLDAEVHLANPERLLKPGMYGRAELELSRHVGSLALPAEAVQLSNGQAFVYVLEGDTARRKPVTLGEDLGEKLEVVGGLTAGTTVITRGIDALADGAKVRTPAAR
jgi:RND family efflux transporter MFP subunit